MKKYDERLVVVENCRLNERYFLLKLERDLPLPEILPGQFVNVLVENSPATFLRRPISVNLVDRTHNRLWLLIAIAGEGTRHLSRLQAGDTLDVLYPLGSCFTIPQNTSDKVLLCGGGVGTAPMLYLGKTLKENGFSPVFLLGARKENDLLQLDEFAKWGTVCTTTEDGSFGEQGFVTQHSVLNDVRFDHIFVCGPTPMMLAMAHYAADKGIDCEVSLENKMACGVGACLCCVEKTTNGNECVCTKGPVFNIKDLLWQI